MAGVAGLVVAGPEPGWLFAGPSEPHAPSAPDTARADTTTISNRFMGVVRTEGQRGLPCWPETPRHPGAVSLVAVLITGASVAA